MGWCKDEKCEYQGNIQLTKLTWTVCKFKRGIVKKEGGGVFEGDW